MKKMSGNTIVITFFLMIILSGCANKQTLNDGKTAFFKHEISKALEICEHVAHSDASAEDQSEAAIGAAILQWRYYKEHDKGKKYLIQGFDLGEEQASALIELSRLEEDRGNYSEALEAALHSIQVADTAVTFQSARIRYATIIVISHIKKLLGLEPTLPESVSGLLDHAHDTAHIVVEADPGDLPSSYSLLLSSILLGDGENALLGWQSYFRISEGTSAGKILDSANKILSELLPEWTGDSSEISTTTIIVRALSDSRMFIPAAAMALMYIPADQQPQDVQDIVSYALFTQWLVDLTDEYYRNTAIGKDNFAKYHSALLNKMKSTWEQWHWTKEPFPLSEPFTLENARNQRDKMRYVRKLMKDRFGVYISLGKTAGYDDLHYGHAVVEETRTIEQYGKKGEITFVLLDRMVSNGFQSWAWYYQSQHGGWARSGVIYQVRSVYTDGPRTVWQTITDPTMNQKTLERLERLRREDLNIAKENPYAYLPGLHLSLRFNAGMELYNQLKKENLSGTALKNRFIAELERIIQDYSIFAHEGRHVIDKREGIESSEEREFRAKLSEIAFSDYPKMAFAGGIYKPNIGGKTPHGQANLRIITGLVSWMDDNKDQIAGFDSTMPTIMQVDKLTDDQLVTAIRTMDPLVKK